jgi:hypothetical protein
MADRLNITDLDFDTIKANLKTFLKQQNEFTDYDFEGSSLSVLLDLLAYNTHYNAYYLNMVANESFLDTAVLRDSVISHAKTLGYTPYSVTAPKAIVNITVETGDSTPGTASLNRGYSVAGSLVDAISYRFNVLDTQIVTKSGTQYVFENVGLYEGRLTTTTFAYSSSSNPKSIFTIPDTNIDTTSIKVSVTPTSGNTYTEVYTKATDIVDIDGTSKVFFLQETRNGKFQIYFGNNAVGKSLTDGSTVEVSYLVTNGAAANGTEYFIAEESIGGSSSIAVSVVSAASGGGSRESVDSIKYSAQSQYATQNRLVTFKDYESYIKKAYPAIDSLSVWGGEDENPPLYGRVLVSLKPKDGFFISEVEKQRIIDEIIAPKSIVAVTTEIREPEYLYLLVKNFIKYDAKKTSLNPDALRNAVRNAIISYRTLNLNKFGSTFVLSKLQDSVDSVDTNSILGSECILRLKKKFTPEIAVTKTYEIPFNTELHRGTVTNRLGSTEFDVYDNQSVRRTVRIEEVPDSFTGIDEILVTNGGSGYSTTPLVTITGDGTGATAEAVVVNQKVQSIVITNRGLNYSRAIITISGGSGFGASAIAVLNTRFGDLRIVYFDTNAERKIVNSKAGTINYDAGLITLNDLQILSSASPDGDISIDIESENGIISSQKNTIITIDLADPSSISTDLQTI